MHSSHTASIASLIIGYAASNENARNINITTKDVTEVVPIHKKENEEDISTGKKLAQPINSIITSLKRGYALNATAPTNAPSTAPTTPVAQPSSPATDQSTTLLQDNPTQSTTSQPRVTTRYNEEEVTTEKKDEIKKTAPEELRYQMRNLDPTLQLELRAEISEATEAIFNDYGEIVLKGLSATNNGSEIGVKTDVRSRLRNAFIDTVWNSHTKYFKVAPADAVWNRCDILNFSDEWFCAIMSSLPTQASPDKSYPDELYHFSIMLTLCYSDNRNDIEEEQSEDDESTCSENIKESWNDRNQNGEHKDNDGWSWKKKPGSDIQAYWYKNLNKIVLLNQNHQNFDWCWISNSLTKAVCEYNTTVSVDSQCHFDMTWLQNVAETTARRVWLGTKSMEHKSHNKPEGKEPFTPTIEWINWYKNNISLRIVNHEWLLRGGTASSYNVITKRRPILGNFLDDEERIKGLENLLVTARNAQNSWAGSLAYGNRITWFNKYTSSFFLKGACLCPFEPMKPRQIRAKFRDSEKIARGQYQSQHSMLNTDRSKLPAWIKLFFEFFDWNKGKTGYTIVENFNEVRNTTSNTSSSAAPVVNRLNYATPTTNNDEVKSETYVQQPHTNNIPVQPPVKTEQQHQPVNNTPNNSKVQAAMSHQQQSETINHNTIQETPRTVIRPYTASTLQGVQITATRPETADTFRGEQSTAIRPRFPSPPPTPNTRRKLSDDNNTQLEPSSNNESSKQQQQLPMPPPTITIRPFTQIFADAMMIRQRLNASVTLRNSEDVRFYQLCLDAVTSEIETYRNLQISLRRS